jgi:hypothetical protein
MRVASTQPRMPATDWLRVSELAKHAEGDEEEARDGDEQVAADERPGIEEAGVAGEAFQDVEKAAGRAPEGGVEAVGGAVLGQDDFGGRDGGGEEGLDGAEAAFLGEALHGEQRHHHADRQPEELEKTMAGESPAGSRCRFRGSW